MPRYRIDIQNTREMSYIKTFVVEASNLDNAVAMALPQAEEECGEHRNSTTTHGDLINMGWEPNGDRATAEVSEANLDTD